MKRLKIPRCKVKDRQYKAEKHQVNKRNNGRQVVHNHKENLRLSNKGQDNYLTERYAASAPLLASIVLVLNGTTVMSDNSIWIDQPLNHCTFFD